MNRKTLTLCVSDNVKNPKMIDELKADLCLPRTLEPLPIYNTAIPPEYCGIRSSVHQTIGSPRDGILFLHHSKTNISQKLVRY